MKNEQNSSSSSTTSLTDRMREGTKDIHSESDRAVNLKLVLLLTSRRLYGESVSLFGSIYERLETILERHRDHPHLGLFRDLYPNIQRADSFSADVSYFLSPDEEKNLQKFRSGGDSMQSSLPHQKGEERVNIVNPPALAEYLDRLDKLEREDPIRLIAYVYHMYAAIFAGGYIIKKMVKKAMRLPKDSDEGVKAFSTNVLDDGEDKRSMTGKQIRTEMNRIINELIAPKLTNEEVERVLEESVRVFEGNNAVIASVQVTEAFESASARMKKRIILVPIVVAVLAISVRWFSRRSRHI